MNPVRGLLFSAGILLGLITLEGTLHGQGMDGVRVALIDLQRVQRDCYYGELQKQEFDSINRQERTELSRLETEMDKTSSQLKPLVANLRQKAADNSPITDEERNRLGLLRSGFRSVQEQIKKEQTRYTTAMSEVGERLHGELLEQVYQSVDRVASTESLGLVLDRSFGADGIPTLPYGSGKVEDITDRVLTEMNWDAPENWSPEDVAPGMSSTTPTLLRNLRVGFLDVPFLVENYHAAALGKAELDAFQQEGKDRLADAGKELEVLTARRDEIRARMETERAGLAPEVQQSMMDEGREVERRMLELIQSVQETGQALQAELNERFQKLQTDLGTKIRNAVRDVSSGALDLVMNRGFEVEQVYFVEHLVAGQDQAVTLSVLDLLNADAPEGFVAPAGDILQNGTREIIPHTFTQQDLALVSHGNVLRDFYLAQKEADAFEARYEKARDTFVARQAELQQLTEKQQGLARQVEAADLPAQEKAIKIQGIRQNLNTINQLTREALEINQGLREDLRLEALDSRTALETQVRDLVRKRAVEMKIRLLMDSGMNVRGVKPVAWFQPQTVKVLDEDVIQRLNQSAGAPADWVRPSQKEAAPAPVAVPIGN